ncbi:hypothetical protein PGQ11_009294 [Apiospora arundinis]|uniref:Uncharacterized protein n=1 Tax=Apiospora arundinis TaxID=335852 RepID=A0ABR2IHQ9_9PEZI
MDRSSRWNNAYYLDMAQHRNDAYEGLFQQVQTEAIRVFQAQTKTAPRPEGRKETLHDDN